MFLVSTGTIFNAHHVQMYSKTLGAVLLCSIHVYADLDRHDFPSCNG